MPITAPRSCHVQPVDRCRRQSHLEMQEVVDGISRVATRRSLPEFIYVPFLIPITTPPLTELTGILSILIFQRTARPGKCRG